MSVLARTLATEWLRADDRSNLVPVDIEVPCRDPIDDLLDTVIDPSM